MDIAQKLIKLRKWLEKENLAAFLVPLSDPYQNEFVLPAYNRLKWLTGFGGSAGFCIVSQTKAALFVDGRYTEEAKQTIDPALFSLHPYTYSNIVNWLRTSTPKKGMIGFDPWIHPATQISHFQEKLASQLQFVACSSNPIDTFWEDRPPFPKEPCFLLSEKYAGESAQAKRIRLGKALAEKGADAHLIIDATSLNWLLNIRGHDLPYTPVIMSYGLLTPNGKVKVFSTLDQYPLSIRQALGDDISFFPTQSLLDHLSSYKNLLLPLAHTPYAIQAHLSNHTIAFTWGDDLCTLPKALKNKVEQEGFRQAHLLDGTALTRFLSFLDKHQGSLDLTESSAAALLETYRRASSHLQGLSFPTISAVGANSALPHYQPRQDSDIPLRANTMYLVDSGGQYKTGTTDVTRTIFLGPTPSPEQKKHYTLVLKGHIALAKAIFPPGTSGIQLDMLARQPLLQEGLEYNHGTGHGVGHFLNVHEGPQGISPRANPHVSLQPGMILSNEPGFYEAGAYGIRLENMILVKKAIVKNAKTPLLAFETLTLAPMARNLIEIKMLTQEEKTWLNIYHKKVWLHLAPLLPEEDALWLKKACAPF